MKIHEYHHMIKIEIENSLRNMAIYA